MCLKLELLVLLRKAWTREALMTSKREPTAVEIYKKVPDRFSFLSCAHRPSIMLDASQALMLNANTDALRMVREKVQEVQADD